MTTALIQESRAQPAQAVGDDDLYEVIDGQRVGLPPMSIFAVWINSQLSQLLGPYVRTHNLGRLICEGLFHIPAPINRDRRPDLAFVSYQRWAKSKPVPRMDNAWDVVPDFVVEVVSPTDVAENLQEKIEEYFRVGVSRVWVVYPLRGQVHDYESATQVRILTAADELHGGTLLPGFRLALTELFTEPVTNGTPA
jgi:Uma2 family endonuclease